MGNIWLFCKFINVRKTMKVCIIGDFSEYFDEGLKNIAHSIADNLSRISNVELLKINVKKIYSFSCLKRIKNFLPDIIHYIPGPTNKSIVFLKFLKIYLRNNSKIVLSTPYPLCNDIMFKLFFFKPDHVFSSSNSFDIRMKNIGISSSLLSNGVDIQKFCPVDDCEKDKLKAKYNIAKDSYILLHVGHIKKNRNLESILDLSKNNQIVVVASKYLEMDAKIRERLISFGVIIVEDYIPEIEEFYQLSDCYIFPVKPGNSISNPMSVLEAMSVNLPVICTRFDGIQSFFSEGNGLVFVNGSQDFQNAVENIKDGESKISTRRKVEPYSWQKISRDIKKIYDNLLEEGDAESWEKKDN